MSTLNIGIIGTGNISEEHIQAYQKNPETKLYAFCDINEGRLKQMAQKYGVENTYTNLEEMLSLKDLDAVSVCTWNSAHAACVIAALDAGKHVLCEKPMATSAKEAAAMKEAADRNGKLLMIGFVRRFGNDCSILKEFTDTGFLGEIYYAKATYLRRNGNPGGWFGDKSRSGGGPLIDLGVHVIDLVRYLMGNPRPVSVYGAAFQKLYDRSNLKTGKAYTASGDEENPVCDVEDLAAAMIRFDNGAVLSLETSFSLNLKQDQGRIELFGTKGGAKIEPELELYTEANGYMTNVSLEAKTALDFSGLFENEITHFVSCITKNTDCISPADDGIEIMNILDSVYESARTGHEVVLTEP